MRLILLDVFQGVMLLSPLNCEFFPLPSSAHKSVGWRGYQILPSTDAAALVTGLTSAGTKLGNPTHPEKFDCNKLIN